MKKPLLYTSIAGLAILAGVAATVSLGNVNAEPTSSNNFIATAIDQTSVGTALQSSKDETIYIITDNTGAPTKTFVGNILDSTASDLPVDLKITYFLDNEPISAKNLAGKSGHIKIVFNCLATKTYQGKHIPFLTITGLSLDNTKFKNLKIDNGKIINENDSTIIAGYSIAGLNENLGTDILPNNFTIEADVTDFSLDTTYTLATNEIFAELDTSKLSTIDNLVNSMSQLESGINQILDGATALDNGLDALAAGVKALQSGAESLNNGASQLASGASELNAKVNEELAPSIAALDSGLNGLSTNSANITGGAMQIFQALLDNTSAEINVQLTPGNYATILNNIITNPTTPAPVVTKLTQAKYLFDNYTNFYAGLSQYTGTVDYIATQTPALSAGAEVLANGTTELSTGASQLLSGTVTLKNGADQLADGSARLASSSQALKTGISTFKSEGIDKLVHFASNDIENFLTNFRSSVYAAKSYHQYKSTTAESVKFIFKTPSIE